MKLLQPDGCSFECIVAAEARAQRTASRLSLGFQLLRQRFRQPRGAPVACSERTALAKPAHARRVVRLVPRQRQHQLRRACSASGSTPAPSATGTSPPYFAARQNNGIALLGISSDNGRKRQGNPATNVFCSPQALARVEHKKVC
jgi:hypothetical protein